MVNKRLNDIILWDGKAKVSTLYKWGKKTGKPYVPSLTGHQMETVMSIFVPLFYGIASDQDMKCLLLHLANNQDILRTSFTDEQLECEYVL